MTPDHGEQDLGAQGDQLPTNPQSNQVPAPGYQGIIRPVTPTTQAPQNTGGPGQGNQQPPAASQPAQGGPPVTPVPRNLNQGGGGTDVSHQQQHQPETQEQRLKGTNSPYHLAELYLQPLQHQALQPELLLQLQLHQSAQPELLHH